MDGTGVCPIGYSKITSEAECRAVKGQTVSGIRINSFATSNCMKSWTPPQTCFAYTDQNVYHVNKDCGQNLSYDETNPVYETHRIVCKKEGNHFKMINDDFQSSKLYCVFKEIESQQHGKIS